MNQKKKQVEASSNSWLDGVRSFEQRWSAKHEPPETFYKGNRPKYGLPNKATTFLKDFTHVRFDRKTLPKSGKNIQDGCFVEDKGSYHLIWDIKTRALLGLDIKKIKEYRKDFDELIREPGNN